MFDKFSSPRSSSESDGSIKGRLRALVLGNTHAVAANSETTSTSDAPYWSSASTSGPSQVAWLRSASGFPPPQGARIIGRSTSSQSLPSRGVMAPTPRPMFYTESAQKSSQSLRLDPRCFASVWDDPYGHPGVKQLSPIAEQEYLSPERRSLHLPSEKDVASSHGSTLDGSVITRPSPVFSTFINRPLNRSISQTSSRTHISTVSAPPSIPTLDLRHAFGGPNNGPSVRTPITANVRTMPTILGSSEGHAGGMYDDASSVIAESFTTADSLYQLGGLPAAGDVPAPAVSLEDYPWTRNSRYSLSGHQSMNDYGDTGSQVGLGSIPSVASRPRSVREYSQASTSSSFFNRRWRRSEHYGTGMASFPKLRKPRFGETITPACWMFFLGFVAPWCWILGGWYFTIRGETRPKTRRWKGKEKEKRELALPRWIKERKQGAYVSEKEAALHGIWFGYPFVAPSVGSLPPTATVRSTNQGSLSVLDPWIFRCRVAAFTSGVLVVIAFVTAFIVVGKKYG